MNTLKSVDQLGNTVEFNFPPQRIISLVPSQTELLFDLGLDEQIVGVTRYCVHPAEKVKSKPKIGGTKKFDFDKIKALDPDLIIGNKEENYQAGIEELQKYYPVWMSDIYTLKDALAMMAELGNMLGCDEKAKSLINEIERAFSGFEMVGSVPVAKLTVAYFIWRNPYMVAAGKTFINEMLKVFGVRNAFEDLERYPEITGETLSTVKPDYIFLSTEPYSFTDKHIEEFKALSPTSKVLLADGELFSWYGSRLKRTPAYFEQLHRQMD